MEYLPDYYQILGVDRDASEEEISSRYHYLSFQVHPDRAPEHFKTQAEEDFKKIKEAYDILKDINKRKEYNEKFYNARLRVNNEYSEENESESSKIVRDLIRRLRKGDRENKVFAAKQLGELGDPMAVSPLIRALNVEGNTSVRKEVARALGKINDYNSIEALRDALKDENISVRDTVIEALAKFEDIRVAYSLIAYLFSDEFNQRSDNIYSIHEIIIDFFYRFNNPQSLDMLAKILKYDYNATKVNSGWYIRKLAAECLGNKNDPRAVDHLIKAFKGDKDLTVQESAVDALGKLKDHRAFDHLVEFITNPPKSYSNKLCYKVPKALLEIDYQNAVNILLNVINSNYSERDIFSGAVKALSETNDQRLVEPFISIVNAWDESWPGPIRDVIICLSNLNDPRAVDPLAKIAKKISKKSKRDIMFRSIYSDILPVIEYALEKLPKKPNRWKFW